MAATYITIAAAMDPDKQVYQTSYRMLQGKLRLPSLLAGPLLLHTTSAMFTAMATRPQWRASKLDAAGLHLLPPAASRVSQVRVCSPGPCLLMDQCVCMIGCGESSQRLGTMPATLLPSSLWSCVRETSDVELCETNQHGTTWVEFTALVAFS